METEKGESNMPRIMRMVFGIIMIIFYLVLGVLILCGMFPQLSGSFEWLRWVGGVVIILYGLWRAYRQFKGIDPDVTTRY